MSGGGFSLPGKSLLCTLSNIALFVYHNSCNYRIMHGDRARKGFSCREGLVLTVLGFAFALVLVSRMGVAELITLAITTIVSFLNWLLVRGHTPPP